MGFTFIVTTQHEKGLNLKPGALGQVNSHVASVKHARHRVLDQDLQLPKRRRQKPKVIALELRHPERRLPEVSRHYDILQGPKSTASSFSPATAESISPCTIDYGLQRKEVQTCEEISSVTTTTTPLSSDETSSLTDGSSFDSQVLSGLDPFVRLPMLLNPREKELIHFFLTHGRKFIFRKPLQASIDPPLQVASRLLQNSPIYILAHLVIAEKIMCKLNRTEVSTSFYLKRAQAYKAMNDLLNDPNATFHDKMTGFTQLSILERTLGCHDLLKKHVQTMDTYLEDNGGLGRFLQEKRDRDTTLDPWNYVFHWKYCAITIDMRNRLDRILARFSSQLEHIGRWHHSLSYRTKFPNSVVAPTLSPGGVSRFDSLFKYITHHINTNLGFLDVPYSEMTSTFLFISSLCLTQVKNNYSAVDSLNFLTRVNRNFEDDVRSDVTNDTAVSTLDLSAALFYVQDDHDHPGLVDTEICQSKIDILRLLPLISSLSKVQLAKRLTQCALGSSSISIGKRPFDPSYIAGLIDEINHNWIVEQLELSPNIEQIETLEEETRGPESD